MARSILLTQCVQNDFLRPLLPGEPLPNLVHVGRLEADRLCGPSGSLVAFLERAHAFPSESLAIVHVVDRHRPERDAAHLERFRPHCLAGTEGADLVGRVAPLAAGRAAIVEAADLNDMEDSPLAGTLREATAGGDLREARVAVVGVWTDAKVSFLLYDLATRLRIASLATCSALTASRSHEAHFRALDSLSALLGVRVLHSPESLLAWLAPGAPVAPPAPRGWIRIDGEAAAQGASPAYGGTAAGSPERDALLDDLVRGPCHLRPLHGGFSGAQVFVVRDEAPDAGAAVLKVGPRDEIARERFGNERVRRILGDAIPGLLAAREGATLGAMKLELAGSDEEDGEITTFKRLHESDASVEATAFLERCLDRVLSRSLGRLYRTAEKDNGDLLEIYGFVDRAGRAGFAGSVAARAAAIAGSGGHESAASLASAHGMAPGFMDPVAFYREWLPGRTMVREVYPSLVHGDLNLANVLASRSPGAERPGRIWIIDFARLATLPCLTDFAKIENDLAYILHPLPDEAAFSEALRLQEARLGSPTLPLPGLEGLARTPEQERHVRLVSRLRHIAAATDPRGEEAMADYRVALLRFAAHTLGFDEPSPRQLRLALLGVARLAGLVAAGPRGPGRGV